MTRLARNVWRAVADRQGDARRTGARCEVCGDKLALSDHDTPAGKRAEHENGDLGWSHP